MKIRIVALAQTVVTLSIASAFAGSPSDPEALRAQWALLLPSVFTSGTTISLVTIERDGLVAGQGDYQRHLRPDGLWGKFRALVQDPATPIVGALYFKAEVSGKALEITCRVHEDEKSLFRQVTNRLPSLGVCTFVQTKTGDELSLEEASAYLGHPAFLMPNALVTTYAGPPAGEAREFRKSGEVCETCEDPQCIAGLKRLRDVVRSTAQTICAGENCLALKTSARPSLNFQR